MSEKVTVEKSDLRSPFPSFTGNFIVAGQPKETKTANGWVYSFSIYWQNWSAKEGYHGANYKRCVIFANDESQMAKIRADIHGKVDGQPGSRIHIVDGFPTQRTYTGKDGVERTEEEVRIKSYYPYHLNKELGRWEKSGTPSSGAGTSSGVVNYGATEKSGETLF